jgi:hypothetical protein
VVPGDGNQLDQGTRGDKGKQKIGVRCEEVATSSKVHEVASAGEQSKIESVKIHEKGGKVK